MRWVDGTDLENWADRRDCQERLPELITRLVHATTTLPQRVQFRTGEGVQLPGWDGVVETTEGNAWVPVGKSCWEIGTGKSPKAKADTDYEKRANDPLGHVPRSTTFMFVTPRRWADKDAWVNEKQSQQHWADVRAYDADDLEGWLAQAPAVGAWLAQAVGKYPRGVRSLEDFWAEFSFSTNPAFPSAALLAGREDATKRLLDWMQSGPRSVRVRADTTNEVLAFLSSVVEQLPPDERSRQLSRTIIVQDSEAAREVIATRHTLLICWNLAETEPVGIAVERGHHVLLPVDPTIQLLPKEDIDLPRLAEESLIKTLRDAGLTEERARGLVRGTGRRLQPLRRHLARSPTFARPGWAQPDHGTSLVAILLAGSWDERDTSDREALESLAGRPYCEVESVARRWAVGADVPVKYANGVWRLVSPLDAWYLLGGYISPSDLKRFRAISVEILGTESARAGLPLDQRWISTTKPFSHSHRLRDGVAQTLVLLAVLGEQGVVGNRAQDVSKRVVTTLLNNGLGWLRWYSLSGLLPLLAEAAPDEFLAGLEEFLIRDPGSTHHLFVEEDPYGGGSAHTGILWALEGLAWFPQYLGQATVLLGMLARLDPGGRMANRPKASLREIFLLWHPNTGANLSQRFQALDLLVQREPNVAWEVLVALLPRSHEIGMPTHTPQWRQYSGAPPVTTRELYQGIRGVIGRAVNLAGNDGERISVLVRECASWPPDLRSKLVAHITSFSATCQDSGEKLHVWEAVRVLVNRHRAFPDAAWALPESELASLAEQMPLVQPSDAIQRSLWLFQDWFPELPNPKSDLKERDEEIERHRREAVKDVLAERKIEGLYELARLSKFPRFVGGSASAVITSRAHEEEIITSALRSREDSILELGMGFVSGRYRSGRAPWVDDTLQLIGGDDRSIANFFLALPSSREVWMRVASAGRNVEKLYWGRTRLFLGEHDDLCDVEFAFDHLLEADNVHAAVDVAWGNASRLPAVKLVSLLDILVGKIADKRVSLSQHVAFTATEILGALSSKPDATEDEIARLEWAYLPLLHHGRLSGSLVLHKRLARDPAFFAELIALVFKARPEEGRPKQPMQEPSEEERARARLGYELLSSWEIVPGTRGDGSIDHGALEAWVRSARSLCRDSGHADVGDIHIGEVLAHAPVGSDGVWPHEAVRFILEQILSRSIEEGFSTGTYNQRGMVTRSFGEGGAQEKILVNKYRGFAEALGIQWPRTAACLRSLADQYEREGDWEDASASLDD